MTRTNSPCTFLRAAKSTATSSAEPRNHSSYTLEISRAATTGVFSPNVFAINSNNFINAVRRVLKKGGAFYSATFGEHGIIEYLSKILGTYGVEDNVNKNFTLQNGEKILAPFFSDVQRMNYEDSLAVTEIDDLIEYIYSLSSMTSLSSVPKEEIRTILKKYMVNGVLTVPKEYGIFCCRKI